MKDSTKKVLGLQELREKIEITPTTVECPVNDCPVVVERQHQHFRKENRFRCSTHNIYISPSTFEYQNYNDNLLWKDPEDIKLLESIFKEKRESRMARDNSEDAVTWNVFRYLEKNNLIEGFLSQLTGTKQENAEVIYWSYSQREGHAWTCLNKGREEFGEEEGRGSEPDIIVKTDKTLFFIEAKLTSGNQTTPSVKNNSKKYETGGNNWFKEVFNTNYKTIAITEKKYELMRFWLLGTWMAEQACPRFYLINLVREQQEEGIEPVFKRHIKESLQRKFFRVTWESIYKYVSEQSEVNDKVLMIRFFENKTIGYKNGTLQKAFSINPRD